MKTHRLYVLLGLALLVALTTGLALAQSPKVQAPLGSVFTYQGRLTDAAGTPIDDTCDLRFSLWDDGTAGAQVGSTVEMPGLDLDAGLFTAQLDFGSVFDGTSLWIKVEVKCSADAVYVPLDPRQPLTAVPYTLHALDADLLEGQPASAFASVGHSHSAADITSGSLATDRYSAYDDLGAEGRLDNNAGSDLLTRVQADGRFVNEGQTDSVTSAMIVDGTVAAADLEDGAALAEILDDDGPGSTLDADTLDGLQSGDFARIGRYFIPGGTGGTVAIPFPHYRAFQVIIGEAFGYPDKVAWVSGIENDGNLAWLAIDSVGTVSTGTCDLDNAIPILTLGGGSGIITLSCPGNGNLELTLTSSYEDVHAFLIW